MNQGRLESGFDRNRSIFAPYFTIAGPVIPFVGDARSPFDLRDRIDAAARAGFCGIGLETNDLRHCVEQHGCAGIRKLLADAELDYFELEVLVNWFADGPEREASDRDREMLLRAAAEIDTAQIKVIGAVGANPELSRMTDEFGSLCDQGRVAGTVINLEIYPDSNVRDLATARAIIEGAGRANGGLLIDIWHMGRGGIPYEDLVDLPSGMIKAIEVSDAAAEQMGTIFEDTIHRRLMPGEGSLDVPRFLRSVWANGYDGPIGVEVLSDVQRSRSLDEAATIAFESTLAQLDRATADRSVQA